MFVFEGIPQTKSGEEFRLEVLWPTRTTGKSRGLGLGPQGAEGLELDKVLVLCKAFHR